MNKKELSVIDSSILTMIPRGKERKVPLTEISQAVGIDDRSVQAVISKLIIVYGVPICASRGVNSDNGFYIPITEKERIEGLQSIKMQTINMTQRIKSVEAADLNTWNETLIYNHQDELEV